MARAKSRRGAYRKLKTHARATLSKKEWTAQRRALYQRNVMGAAAIRYYRIENDVTQRELAEVLGIATGSVTSRESGRVNVTAEMLREHIRAVDKASRIAKKEGS